MVKSRTINVTLNEEELKEAIKVFLEQKDIKTKIENIKLRYPGLTLQDGALEIRYGMGCEIINAEEYID